MFQDRSQQRRASDQNPIKRFDACYSRLDVRYDVRRPEEIVIEGIIYSTHLFVDIGLGPLGMKDGELYRLEKREDGIVWITRLSEEGVLAEAKRLFNKETFDAAVRIEIERLRHLTAWQRFKERVFSRIKRK
jgi:hypothetical protein